MSPPRARRCRCAQCKLLVEVTFTVYVLTEKGTKRFQICEGCKPGVEMFDRLARSGAMGT